MPILDRAPANGRKANAKTQRSLKVLCIDNDPSVVNALARNLQSRGANALGAYHGMQGYWLACTEQPDVIVTDIMMPRGHGDYVVECLRRNAKTQSIPVIVLSGYCSPKLEDRVRELGVEHVFAKPARFEVLFNAICALAE